MNFDERSPTQKRYRLQDMITGEFVLMTQLDKRTKKPELAWIGTERQLLNVRARFPHTRTMNPERVRSL